MPLTVKAPLPLAATSPLVKCRRVCRRPRSIVPEKSLVGAAVLASLNVAVSVAGVTPSTPPLTVTVPAVSGASATVVDAGLGRRTAAHVVDRYGDVVRAVFRVECACRSP